MTAMKTRVALLSALLAVVVIAVWWLRRSEGPPVPSSQDTTQASDRSTNHAAAVGNAAEKEEAQTPAGLGQIEKSRLSAEEMRKEFQRRSVADRRWEWKIPISFFGKVIDQDNQPVADATVHFHWTALSPQGTSRRTAVSDSRGLFALRGEQGKTLGVRVEKIGYYTVDGGQGMVGFEYASPYEKTFHEPDEAHPVIFRLVKKGEAEPLLQRSVELDLPGNGSKRAVDLLIGKASETGSLQITAWKPPLSTEPIPKPYDWRIMVGIASGGFVECQDILPFTAPEDGYVSSVDLHMSPDLGTQWSVGVERNYYFRFGTPPRYGRLTLRTNGDSKVVFLDYFLNPKPGSRNLEFDPAKAIKPKP